MKYLFSDKKFLNSMIKLATPIMIQNLIFSSLGLVDGLMIGQLGEEAVAAVGIANQVFFLVSLLFFGITSGTAIFTAQYWGNKDVQRIQSVLGFSLLMSVTGALIFSSVAIFFPVKVISIYTTDPSVISQGSKYLQVIGFSYVLTAITNSFSTALRSTENVKLPMLISLLALSINTLLNYTLILGNFGLPALGVVGAAIATVCSRLLETGLLLFMIYRQKLPVAAKLSALFNFKILSLAQFFKTTLPVIATEIAWSFGITTYNVVFARIGTESIAAVNIASTLDRLIFVVFIGLGNACAIMVGNKIGAGEEDTATDYGKKFLILGLFGASFFGLIMVALANPLLALYKVSATTINFTFRLMIIMAAFLPIRSLNLIILIGILRSGGDTRYAFFIDAGSVWAIGVPLVFLGAFVLNFPIYLVYLMVMTEEVIKLCLGLYRFFSQR
ncbi:MAG: MATE family efflux transporter, partial [Anaerolineales bacterium]|nr:MATE family efflux transporter [Anaerolineales bacterium]